MRTKWKIAHLREIIWHKVQFYPARLERAQPPVVQMIMKTLSTDTREGGTHRRGINFACQRQRYSRIARIVRNSCAVNTLWRHPTETHRMDPSLQLDGTDHRVCARRGRHSRRFERGSPPPPLARRVSVTRIVDNACLFTPEELTDSAARDNAELTALWEVLSLSLYFPSLSQTKRDRSLILARDNVSVQLARSVV